MALAPRFTGLKLAPGASGPKAVHTLELYLDYVCPFSARLFKTLYRSVLPTIRSKYAPNLSIIFRPQIQPWHPSSTLTTEAAVAVQRLAPEKFWDFSAALFEQQTEFFDVNVVHEGRNETYKRLAKVAGSVGVSEGDVFGLLKVQDKPGEGGALNVGNRVTDDVKILVKMNRLVGVHVTPTVILNGVVENNISSGWTKEQWEEWLEKNVV